MSAIRQHETAAEPHLTLVAHTFCTIAILADMEGPEQPIVVRPDRAPGRSTDQTSK